MEDLSSPATLDGGDEKARHHLPAHREEDGQSALLAKHPRVRVAVIVMDYLAYGWSPDEIRRQHPHLTLAEVHAAMGYYYDHQPEIDAEITEELEEVDRALGNPKRLPAGRSGRIDRKLGNQENGCMKTTLDLPDALVKQVKLRALRDGRKLKDAVADLLRKGLAVAANAKPDARAPVVTTDRGTGLPLIECKRAATPQEEVTAERMAEILLAQEAGWHDAAG
ncbi:MAG TPA: DUF433 domain-containing protein [Gemmataceae bacterium]